jgi:hypothetical protein
MRSSSLASEYGASPKTLYREEPENASDKEYHCEMILLKLAREISAGVGWQTLKPSSINIDFSDGGLRGDPAKQGPVYLSFALQRLGLPAIIVSFREVMSRRPAFALSGLRGLVVALALRIKRFKRLLPHAPCQMFCHR